MEVVRAPEATTWQVRLAEPWAGAHVGVSVGLVRKVSPTTWACRFYVARSPEPSRPAGQASTKVAAVQRVVDAWLDNVA